MIFRKIIITLFLFLSTAAICQADEHPHPLPPKKPALKSITISLSPDISDVVTSLNAECLRPVVGDFANQGFVSEIILRDEDKNYCLSPGIPVPTDGNVLHTAIIYLKYRNVILVRVDQNFGGSSSLRRYLIFAVVERKPTPPATLANLRLRLISSLPANIVDDDLATNAANKIITGR